MTHNDDKTNGKIIAVHIYILIFLDSKLAV